jgi:protein-tyrosine phosphatase
MIDIHCHIIPNIDDGSRSIEDSVRQLRDMADGGIESVFLTSHYFKGHYEYTRETYNQKFEELSAALRNQSISINLIPGFEVFLQHGIQEDIAKHNLTMGNSSYVLVETELNGLPDDFYANIYSLLRKGYKPILAHAERYVSLMNRPEKIDTFIDRNLYVQINTGSLTGQYGNTVMRAAWKMLDNGWVHFLGSDDHVRSQFGSYLEALEMIEEKYDSYTATLLSSLNPSKIIQNEPIDYRYLVKRNENSRSKREPGLLRKIFGR